MALPAGATANSPSGRRWAFYECGLREVSFEAGSGLRLVGRYAFSANEGLRRGDVRFPAGAAVSDEAFELDSCERLYRKLYRNRWGLLLGGGRE